LYQSEKKEGQSSFCMKHGWRGMSYWKFSLNLFFYTHIKVQNNTLKAYNFIIVFHNAMLNCMIYFFEIGSVSLYKTVIIMFWKYSFLVFTNRFYLFWCYQVRNVISLFYTIVPSIRPLLLQWKSEFMRGMASPKVDNLVVFYYLSASENGVACCGSDFIRRGLLFYHFVFKLHVCIWIAFLDMYGYNLMLHFCGLCIIFIKTKVDHIVFKSLWWGR
jgi:hypothetical protein